MSKHMILWHEGEQDTIEVFQKDPTVVVLAKRGDLEVLKTLEAAKKAGVYILLNGSNLRYIGQASGTVYSRLTSHGKSKDWWQNLIFFGRLDGHLDKAQLDYLENKLITLFQERGFTLDNQTVGNTSYISPYQRGQAESLWSDTLTILEHTAKINVFKLARVKARPIARVALPASAPVLLAASALESLQESSKEILQESLGEGLEETAVGLQVQQVPLSEVNLHTVRGGIKSFGKWLPATGEVRVLAGSECRIGEGTKVGQTRDTIPKPEVANYARFNEQRHELLAARVLGWQGGKLVFLKDYTFVSPSGAASLVLGASATGRWEWKVEDGRSLGEYLER